MNNSSSPVWPWESPQWHAYKTALEKPIKNQQELETTINNIIALKQQPVKGNIVDIFNTYFDCVPRQHDHKLQREEFFDEILPFMQRLVLCAPNIIKEHNLLLPSNKSPNSVVFHKQEVACILAMAFFCLFDAHTCRRYSGGQKKFSDFTFAKVWESRNITVLEFILNYFLQVYEVKPIGGVCVSRLLMPPFDWKNCDKAPSIINCTRYPIEETKTAYHSYGVFKTIGSGVLRGRNHPEDILFLTHPECIVTALFCSALEDNETIVISGAERFSRYTGLENSLKFNGNIYRPDNTVEEPPTIILMDATERIHGHEQYTIDFERDLLKALCGFSIVSEEEITVGNWGCSSYGGNKQLKLIQQLIAAGVSGNDLLYSVGEDKIFAKEIMQFTKILQNIEITVGDLYLMYKELITAAVKNRANLSRTNIIGELAKMLYEPGS